MTQFCGSPACMKHTFTQEDIEALLESSIETHIHTRGYRSSVGVQHGNTHSHKRIYTLCGSPAWKHTFTQEDVQVMLYSSIQTHSFRPTGPPVCYLICLLHSTQLSKTC